MDPYHIQKYQGKLILKDLDRMFPGFPHGGSSAQIKSAGYVWARTRVILTFFGGKIPNLLEFILRYGEVTSRSYTFHTQLPWENFFLNQFQI